MPVGQLVTKQTWLLDDVEVRGRVRFAGRPAGEPVGADDDLDSFGIEPDANYRHLISYFTNNNPLRPPYENANVIHCETYPLEGEHLGHSNRQEPWPFPGRKPDAPFRVFDPVLQEERVLRVDDHVRVVGRWTIDHHPEKFPPTRKPGFGLTRVGWTHTELHPIRWKDIAFVSEPPPAGVNETTVSLAAPLHEEVYHTNWLGNFFLGVRSKVFVAEDGSNYHNSVSAKAYIKAPNLPAGFSPHPSLVRYEERLRINGTSLSLDQVRSLEIVDDGIVVRATVTAPATFDTGHTTGLRARRIRGQLRVEEQHLFVGDVNDPANNRSVFQACYSVGWHSRLVALDGPPGSAEVEVVELPKQRAGTVTPFAYVIKNRGPDPVQLNEAGVIHEDVPGVFELESVTGVDVPAWSSVHLHGTLSLPPTGINGAPPPYTLTARVALESSDPVGQVAFRLRATAIEKPLASDVYITPEVDFGRVPIGADPLQSVWLYNGATAVAVADVGIAPEGVNDQFTLWRSFAGGFGVDAGKQREIATYSFCPTVEGPDTAQVRVVLQTAYPFNGTETVERRVHLKGEGYLAEPVGEWLISPGALDFGQMWTGRGIGLVVRFYNLSDAEVAIEGIDVSGPPFVLGEGQFSEQLGLRAGAVCPPRSVRRAAISYQPTDEGRAAGELRIRTSLQPDPLTVPLKGLGVPWGTPPVYPGGADL